MHSAIAGPVTPLLGSLGLHVGVALALLVAVRQPLPVPALDRTQPDAWAGNAVEVDAVATPDATDNVPSSAPAIPQTAAAAAAEPAHEPEPSTPNTPPPPSTPPPPRTERSAPDRPTPKATPAPIRPGVPRPSKPMLDHGAGTTTATASDTTSGTGAAVPATGAFGADALPPGVRSLPSAFTRAIPPATGADPIWQSLPIGAQHPFTIAVEVDAEGHIASAEIVKEKDGSPAATQALHLRERVVALLGGGLFALHNNVGAGRELFRITITLSDTPVHDQDDPAQLVERGFDPPRGGAPGRAYFTLASGRHFEAKVQVLPRP